ncbi:hypothetical protein AB9K26_11165 [Psychroserpens sp. XS_ASV72]|uniref:hypothetical protein n=1 Tax=Psychroserpens sp. XS_ASV72 TaxID=3241293 RepID=UPI003518359D
MKTIKKIILVAAVLVSTLGYAEKGKVLNTRTYAKIAVLEFENVKKGQQLFVKDAQDGIIYSETINTNGTLSKTFDLKELKDGKYTLELNKDFEIIIKPFEITNNQVVFLTSEATKQFKPLVVAENNQLRVSKLNLDNDAVKIEIFYDGDMIYSETVNNETIVNRVYQLSKLETGKYHTVVKAKDRSYINHFEI